ncbi:MAG: hypothetical protein ACK4UU_00070 [Fimbriimonadales bacterium]
MYRGWLMLMAFWGSLLLSRAQVEFPLDYYSFAEIAQRMSVEGRRVECARDLQQRLAVIHLKARSWQQARALLESALDVRFRKISDAENRWILERDPEVARKERRWREQFAAYIEKRRGREVQMFRLLMDKTVPAEEAAERLVEIYREDMELSEVPDEASLKAQMKSVIESFRKYPMEMALREWRPFLRLRQRLTEFMKNFGVHPSASEGNLFGFYRQFLAENPLSSFGFSKELLDWAQRAATDERDATLNMLRELMGITDAPTDSQTIQLVLLDMTGMFATIYGHVWAHDALLAQLRPPISVLETIEQGTLARDYTVALPPEQLAWHLNDLEGKRVPLDAPAPTPTRLTAVAAWDGYQFSVIYQFADALPNPDISGVGGDTFDNSVKVRWELTRLKQLLSQIDAELARAYAQAYEHHQRLVSQSPVNQPLKASRSKHAPLAVAAYRWAQEHQQEIVMEALGMFQWTRAGGGSLAQQIESSHVPYLLDQRDGVWILRCWNAFVERVGDYPLAAVRDLLCSDYSYEAWQRFYRAVSAEQARWLLSNRWGSLRDFCGKPDSDVREVNSFELGVAWLVMAILESLPPAERERFWNPPANAPALTLELARLPLEARTRIAQTLTLWRAALIYPIRGSERAVLLMPPNTWMEQLTLQRDGGWTLMLSVRDPASGELEKVVLLQGYLPSVPIATPDGEQDEEGEPTNLRDAPIL